MAYNPRSILYDKAFFMKYESGGKFSQIIKLIFILAIIGGGVWLTAWRLKKNSPVEKKPDIYLFCTKCLSVYQPKERLGGEHPRICDKCGERAAWHAMQCNDCKEIFANVPEKDSHGGIIQRNPFCPNCGSGNCGFYDLANKK